MFCSSAELPCLLQTTAWAAQKGEKSCHLIHFTFGAEIPKLCETHASFFSMQRCRNVAPLLLVEKKITNSLFWHVTLAGFGGMAKASFE